MLIIFKHSTSHSFIYSFLTAYGYDKMRGVVCNEVHKVLVQIAFFNDKKVLSVHNMPYVYLSVLL